MLIRGNRELFKEFNRFVFLNILGMLGLSVYILADTFFVAWGVGNQGLAALNLIWPLFCFLNGIGLMLGVGGGTRFSLLKARGELDRANRIFTLTLVVGTMIGLMFSVAGILLPKQIAQLLGANASIEHLVATYLQVLFAFSPVFVLNNIVLGFVRNDHNPRLAMIAMTASSFANIGLDYIFIIHLQMGMFGAALATLTSPAVSLMILLKHRAKPERKLFFRKPEFSLPELKNVVGLGSSAFITEFSSGIVMLLFNFTILSLAGNIGLAAYGVIANISIVVIAIYLGISQGIQPLISEHYGRGNIENGYAVLTWAISLALIIGTVCYAGGYFLDNAIIGIFNKEGDPEMTELATVGIHSYFAAFLFMGINIIVAAFFSAVSNPRPSILISLMRGVILIIPLILVLPKYLLMTGVWLVVPVVEMLTLVYALGYLLVFRSKESRQRINAQAIKS